MSAWFSRLKREYEAGHLPAKQYLVLCELGRFDGWKPPEGCRTSWRPGERLWKRDGGQRWRPG